MDALSTHPFFYDRAFGVAANDRVKKTRLVIENGVWLSHNVITTPGCARIGRGAVVGAGAVVTTDIPPYAILAGAPAGIIRTRFDEATIAWIDSSCWWHLDKSDLKRLLAEQPDSAFSPATGLAAARSLGDTAPGQGIRSEPLASGMLLP
ncbi:LbetaH domain-containing protein [Methylorubrum extorquens]